MSEVRVFADLRLDIDGAATHITADGDALDVSTNDVAILVAEIGRLRAPAGPGPLRGALLVTRAVQQHGVGLTVRDGRGPVLQVSAGRHRPRVRVAWRAAPPVIASWWAGHGYGMQLRRRSLAVGCATAAAVVALRRRRGRRTS